MGKPVEPIGKGNLVVARKNGQSVYIGSDIKITVKWVTRGRCVLCVEAPKEIHILRGELFEKTKRGETP